TNAIACSNCGGFFGAELKMAGWDMVIVEGRAKTPVYLLIRDDKAEILPADGFVWGRSTWETEDMLRARHSEPQLRIASIGVAGEVGVRFACIINDRDRAAGRSGVGAVMGAKRLKAIAVRGTQGVAVARPAAFLKAVAAARAKLEANPSRTRLAVHGTMAMMDVTNAYGSLPTRNCRDVTFEGAGRINAKTMRTKRKSDGRANLVTNKACFGCTIACGRVARIDPSHFSVKGKQNTEYGGAVGGLEYESAFALGPMCGVDDIEAATYASAVCNEQGMDPISFGATVAAAMELYEVGAITAKDTGGLKLNFGSAEALVRAAELTGRGEGFGKDLGLGAKRLCDKYRRPELAMTVKGQEFPGYDPRAMQGMALAYATSNRGACHLKASPFTDDFARVATDGKAKIVKDSQDVVAAIDSTGLCLFTRNAWELEDYASQLDAALGGGWKAERLIEVGERIWNLERRFNLAAGLTAADDTLPARVLKEAAKTGAGKGRVAGLAEMLPEYYRLRGWDADGRPTAKTLKRLGLG
ncbi:MAG: aldehyde ferredoxin oxidoreductase family protein, partial [Rhodospirillales bacterium]|nr:aldehyde ferredoxin oxidoreductase family protein [Rhodospirillales bacterium]